MSVKTSLWLRWCGLVVLFVGLLSVSLLHALKKGGEAWLSFACLAAFSTLILALLLYLGPGMVAHEEQEERKNK